MPTQSQTNIADELFAGNGQSAALMRNLDWSKTPLGPLKTWPQSLKTSVSICLHSRHAIRICWGREHIMLYNDAYISVAGGKHPKALGARVRDIWPEIWDTIGPMLNGVLDRGEATWADDLLLLVERNGYAEECYFTFSYSPIRDESGGVGGVFTPVLETTERVIGARRMRTLRQLAEIRGRKPMTVREACVAAANVLSLNPHDLPFAAIYLLEPRSERNCATLAAATAKDGAFPGIIDARDENWLSFADLVRGETRTIHLKDLEANKLGVLPQTPWGAMPEQGSAVPILQTKTRSPIGFLLAGISPRKRLDVEYRGFYEQVAAEIAGAIREAETLEREHALRDEAEIERSKIRDLFIHAPAAIATLSGPEHRFTLANQAYVQLLGRKSADELIGKTVIAAFPELHDQPILGILDNVYRTGVPNIGNELPIKLDVTGSGQPQEVFFNFVFQAVRDSQGKIDGIFVLAIDVTEQVLARQELETREEQTRALANSIPQLAWIAEADGSITWYNRRWYEYTGTIFDQMKGWGWQSVYHPDTLPAAMALYKRSLETGEPFDMVLPLRGADGSFHSFLTRAVPVRDSAGNIVQWFGTNTDIEAQQRSEAALRQSEKLAIVGRLASSIAHEINNPLEAVTNLIYLARITAENQETVGYLKSAEQELDRISQIAGQTLRFHKQQSAHVPTDIAELIDSVLTLFRGKLSRDGIELKLKTLDCPPLVCSAGEIRQVLANLVGNALDAMPAGGTLWLRLRPGTRWCNQRRAVRITIADTGHGMSPETRKHVYEPFYTTKGDTGTGLGLWVSAGIVEKHGGSMHLRSRPKPDRAERRKSGTVFTIVLPHAC